MRQGDVGRYTVRRPLAIGGGITNASRFVRGGATRHGRCSNWRTTWSTPSFMVTEQQETFLLAPYDRGVHEEHTFTGV